LKLQTPYFWENQVESYISDYSVRIVKKMFSIILTETKQSKISLKLESTKWAVS